MPSTPRATNVDSLSIGISMPDMQDSRNWFAEPEPARRRRFPNTQLKGSRILENGRWLVNFASNDYLGLREHPAVTQAACTAIAENGLGSGASRLVCGDAPVFRELEHALAAWKGYEDAMLVGSGMLANIGLLAAACRRHDAIFADRLNHASLIDGARLSGATLKRFPHRDADALARMLESTPAKRRIIVSDGVFSMDGDIAPLARLLELAEAHDALLIVDDAHGIGTLPDPRGATALAGLVGHPRVVEVGTFGKAFGGYGAFVLGSAPFIAGLRQAMRTMIYSTALPAAIARAMKVALALIHKGELTRDLQQRIRLFRELGHGLPLVDSTTAIQPLLLGEDTRALRLATLLRQRGFFVPTIRPPTVPEGTARLRITLSRLHTPEEIRHLISAIRDSLRELQ